MTLLFGEDVIEEEAEAVYRAVSAKMPEDVEVALINGGQPVYYFVISVEKKSPAATQRGIFKSVSVDFFQQVVSFFP